MDYFNNLFGEPALIKRENWDGKEEPLSDEVIARRRQQANQAIEEHMQQQWHTRTARHRPGQPAEETLDIDHEVVD